MLTVSENVLVFVPLFDDGVPVTVRELGSTKTIVESPVTPPDWPWHVYVLAVPAVIVNVFDVGVDERDTPWYDPEEGSDIVMPLGVHTN